MGKYIAIILLIGAGLWYFTTPSKAIGADGLPEAFTNQSYEEAVAQNARSNKPLIVIFSATWCGPCRQMKEDVWPNSTIAAWVKSNAKVIYVDVDQNNAAAQANQIRGIPAMVVFKRGQPVNRTSGYYGPGDLLEWLESNK